MSAALSAACSRALPRAASRSAASLPVQRITTRQMSSAHGPPDPWPTTPEYTKRYYGYGYAIIGLAALIHFSVNNPFTRNRPTPVEPTEVVVVTKPASKHH